MALNKRQYIDGQTIITAANLNEIQDCIIAIEGSYVPKTRTVAGKALSSNITLAASDVGAVPTSRTINSKALTGNITLSAADVGAVPVSRTVNSKALSSNITLNYADVGAVPSTREVNGKALSDDITITASDIGAVPTSRKVAGKALTSDITLEAADVGAVPTSRTINSKALSSNIILSPADIGAVPRTRTVNSKALTDDIVLAAADIGYNSTDVAAVLASLSSSMATLAGTAMVETQADLISKNKFWHAGNNISLASGITLEAYARGVTISNDGNTGCIIGIGYGGRAYFAFFADGAIANARMVDMEQVAKIMKSTTATEALSVGDYRIYSNTLYRVTQAISNGGTLTPNTNCVATTVANELKNAVNLQSTTVSLSNKNAAARLEKQGHIVTLNSPEDFTSAVATTLTKIGTLPSGYIPKAYFRVPFCNVNLSGGGSAFVEVRGEVNQDPGGIYYYYPRASSGATNGSFFASYVVN